MSTRKGAREAHKPPVSPVKSRPDCIAKDDLLYHQRVFSELRDAIEAEQRAVQRAGSARAAFESWATHLHERYGLDPRRGEGVKEDGTIDRAPVEDSSPPPQDD
jgi:hypothetical protein